MLKAGAQVILQYPDAHGPQYRCQPFAGLPIPLASVQVAIIPGDLPQARANAIRLGRRVEAAIAQLLPGVVRSNTGCHNVTDSPLNCHAQGEPGLRRVLVLVGGSGLPASPTWPPLVSAWLTKPGDSAVLICLPVGAKSTLWVPPGAPKWNSIHCWTHDPADAAPEVLAVAGIVPQDWRLFISYRRGEALALADQLFHRLSEFRFDVFLDRFQIEPSANFKARLEDELRDKGTVLVLESPLVMKSDWTRFEISHARMYRLGRLALRMPGGAVVHGIGPRWRAPVAPADFVGAGKAATLTPAALDRVTDWIRKAHSRALTRRRAYLQQTTLLALRIAGSATPVPGPNGCIRVGSAAGSGISKDYDVWTSTYPAGVREFRDAHEQRVGTTRTSVMIGPATFRERERAGDFRWLAERADVHAVDEGKIFQVSRAIARGGL